MRRLGWYWVLAGAGAACGVALSHFCLSVQVSPLSLLATKLSNTSCKAPTSPAKLCDQGARSAVNEDLRRGYAPHLPFSPSVKPLQQALSNPPLRAPSKHLRLSGQSSHLFLIPKRYIVLKAENPTTSEFTRSCISVAVLALTGSAGKTSVRVRREPGSKEATASAMLSGE